MIGTLSLLLAAVAQQALPTEARLQRFEFEQPAMGTLFRIVLYASDEQAARDAAQAAFDRVLALNAVLSDYDPESELRRVCEVACGQSGAPVSKDLFRVLSRSLEISAATDGAFDVTAAPAVLLWRRARLLRELPSAERLRSTLDLIGYRLVELDAQRRMVRLVKPGMWLDLGGIAKGYAADEALRILRERGISCALVDAGGDITTGDPPPARTAWRVAVGLADDGGGQEEAVWLSNYAVATSGDTWQFVEIGGQRYSHIVNPKTGLGMTGRRSATIVAPDAMTADALATALCVLEPRDGLAVIERQPGTAARIVRGAGDTRQMWESARWREFLARDEGSAGTCCSVIPR